MINSPKRRSPKRRSLKRRSLKRRSLKRRSPKRTSVKSRSPKRRSPKRRSHNMSPKRNKLINQLSRSSKLKIPNRLTRSIRRSRNMIHSKKSESNLKGGGWKNGICDICKEELQYYVNAKVNPDGVYEEPSGRQKTGRWIHRQHGSLGLKCRTKDAKNQKDAINKIHQQKMAARAGTSSQNEPSQDEPSQNEPSQDEPSQDEPSQDKPSQDEPSQEETDRIAKELFLSQQTSTKREIDIGKATIKEFETLLGSKDTIYHTLSGQRLYQYFGSKPNEIEMTKGFTRIIKEQRRKYIKLWNYYNTVIHESYDPLCPDGRKLPKNLEDMRKAYKTYKNNKSNESFTEEYERLRNLYSTDNPQDDAVILNKQKKFSYSIDSINRHRNVKNAKYITSPNSIEIHCTIYNTGNASNLKGHVTLIIIRNLTEEQKQKIRLTGDAMFLHNPAKCLNYHKEEAENAEGETYHYGIFNDNTVRWWETASPTVFHTDVSINQVPLNDNPAYSTFFPAHNSAGVLMREYYLHCINHCPGQRVYQGAGDKGSSQLNYQDSTDWGNPLTINPDKTIFDFLIKDRRRDIEKFERYIKDPNMSSVVPKLNEIIILLQQEIQDLESKKSTIIP